MMQMLRWYCTNQSVQAFRVHREVRTKGIAHDVVINWRSWPGEMIMMARKGSQTCLRGACSAFLARNDLRPWCMS